MKLTKTKLKQIIREEMKKVLNEVHPTDPGGPGGMYIRGDTSPVDTSEEMPDTLAEQAIEALRDMERKDPSVVWDWVIEELEGLTFEQQNDREMVNDILELNTTWKLDDLDL